MTGASMARVQVVPHPFQYQGSKRALAPRIAQYLPADTATFWEPFAGSAAMSLYVGTHRLAGHIVLADLNAPLMKLWECVIRDPESISARYRRVWEGHLEVDEGAHFSAVRDRFNQEGAPEDLLYLIARCVAGAIRYNAEGQFNQSRDKRRLGTRPERMRRSFLAASQALRDAEVHVGDFRETTRGVGPLDVLYLDPPYAGTSNGRDRRYYEGMPREVMLGALEDFNRRGLSYILSYDGRTGEKVHGEPLPDSLGLRRLELHAGRSTQSTLSGGEAETVESLYLSPALVARLGGGGQTRV